MGLFLRQTQINRMNCFSTWHPGFWSFLFFPLISMDHSLWLLASVLWYYKAAAQLVASSLLTVIHFHHQDRPPATTESGTRGLGRKGCANFSAHLVRQYAALLLHECYIRKSHEQSCEVCKYLSKFYWQGNCKIVLFQPFNSTQQTFTMYLLFIRQGRWHSKFREYGSVPAHSLLWAPENPNQVGTDYKLVHGKFWLHKCEQAQMIS